MNAINMSITEKSLITLTNEDIKKVNGGGLQALLGFGFSATFIEIGAVAAAGVAIFEAGKYTGEFIYDLTH
jgi:hypothetical protein